MRAEDIELFDLEVNCLLTGYDTEGTRVYVAYSGLALLTLTTSQGSIHLVHHQQFHPLSFNIVPIGDVRKLCSVFAVGSVT